MSDAWYVADNVTGATASGDFDSEDKATGLCCVLNTEHPGGRYGVRKRPGDDDAEREWRVHGNAAGDGSYAVSQHHPHGN